MRNTLVIDTESGELLVASSVDVGENSLYINGTQIPSSSWIGSGTYSTTIGGVTYSITKAESSAGNLQMIADSETSYHFNRIGADGNATVETNSYITAGVITLYRRGNAVQLYGAPTFSAITSSSWTEVGTVPKGFRPIANCFFRDTAGNVYYINASTGVLSARSLTAGQKWLSACYVCAV